MYIIYGLFFVFAGLFILISPQTIKYFNTNQFLFDIASFLRDYPNFRNPFGVISLIVGVLSIVLFFILKNYRNTIFVIQKAAEGDYGNITLHYPKIAKWNNDELYYENLLTLENHDEPIKELEKKRIKKFFERLGPKKQIAFLGISPMPTLVYSGYVNGDSGRKFKYYHWNRKKKKVTRIHPFFPFKKKINITIDQKEIKGSNDYVVCVSSSYQINEMKVLNQFEKCSIINIKTDEQGVDSIFCMKDLNKLVNTVRNEISSISNQNAKIHLLLSCSSEVCFAIGQALNSPAIPKILVYNYDANDKKPWNWYINL